MSISLSELRQRYPLFSYRSAQSDLTAEGLELRFEFASGELVFNPTILIKGVRAADLAERISPSELQQAVFEIGMVELLSYWKIVCSPIIEIEAGWLSPEQQAWFHHLLIHGMGEYFFVNQIDFTAEDFVRFEVTATPSEVSSLALDETASQKILLPVGGGKDSGLSVELFRAAGIAATPLLINPTPAADIIAQLSGLGQSVVIKRSLDPQLKTLNQAGYLNGHTPFSALIAFVTTLTARLLGYTHIAVSNERSSNEGNVMFLGREINHQYSKTFEFESDFQTYIRTHHPGWPEYFSLLRPLYELQIARLFAHYAPAQPRLLTEFRSCNRGQKQNIWCGECSKCLFAYSILYPFLSHQQMVSIFGEDLYEKTSLLSDALELTGYAEKKPLECVGTHEESMLAWHLSYHKIKTEGRTVPALMQLIVDQVLVHETNLDARATALLAAWNPQHAVPENLAKLLQFPLYQPLTHQTLATQQIAIMGLGREGWSSYSYLRRFFPELPLIAIDDKPLAELSPEWQDVIARDEQLSFITTDLATGNSGHAQISLVIKTAGIPLHHPWLQALSPSVTITSNTQLFFDLLKTEIEPQVPYTLNTIGITGTKGKSTTSSMIHHLLKTAQLPTLLGGNIGVPPLELLTQLTPYSATAGATFYLVLELSCHQLADLKTSPHIAVVQNIVPEHLDYYPTFEAYLQAKTQITRWQSADDCVIFNPRFEAAHQLANLSPGTHYYFLTAKTENVSHHAGALAAVQDGQVIRGHEALLPVTDIPLLGAHNWENILPAVVLSQLIGLDSETAATALRTFQPLPHRLEKVATIAGVTYVNDSLSTTPVATMAALAACDDKPVVLIAGGYDRHLSYDELATYLVTHNVPAVVLMGSTGERIAEALRHLDLPQTQTVPQIHLAQSMVEAVTQAHQLATKAQAQYVILSPGSASFGEFKDYRDRGNQFKQAVGTLNSL